MIRVDEFTYLYYLKESKEYGYYELVPYVRDARIVKGLPSSFHYWKSQFFFVSRDDWETNSDEIWREVPRLLRRWGTTSLGAQLFFSCVSSLLTLLLVVLCAVKQRPRLKSRFKQCVETTIKYVRTIEDFDDLVDPRTLALHYLGLEPFAFVL